MQKVEIGLWIIFVISSGLYWWIGKSFIYQPDYNVPIVFRNSIVGKSLVLLPQLGFVCVAIGGFVFTGNGWWFLGAVVGAAVLLSSRPQQF